MHAIYIITKLSSKSVLIVTPYADMQIPRYGIFSGFNYKRKSRNTWIHAYNQVTNTTEYFSDNFRCIFIANIANVLYEATRGVTTLGVTS